MSVRLVWGASVSVSMVLRAEWSGLRGMKGKLLEERGKRWMWM
jgi:hypothetical protein